MKRYIYIFCFILAYTLCTGCGDTSTVDTLANVQKTRMAITTTIPDGKETLVTETSAVTETTAMSETSSDAEVATELSTEAESLPDHWDTVDEDLTLLDTTMAYAQCASISQNAEDYVGKAIRIKGTFDYFQAGEEDAVPGKEYFSVVLSDATACCSIGVEFVLDGEHHYPEDYPELGSEITVTGIYSTYYEGENRYSQLVHAILE